MSAENSDPLLFSHEWWTQRKDLSIPWCQDYCNQIIGDDSSLDIPEVRKTMGIFCLTTPDAQTVPVGITALVGDRFIFKYDPAYVDNPSMPPISHNLPKKKEMYESQGRMLSFFDNLLAEGSFGQAQGAALGRSTEFINGDQEKFEERYHRMMMFSRDCPGAFWGTYAQRDPEMARQQHHEMIAAQLESRSSISGVQPKLLGTMKGTELWPTGYWKTSTHIVKLEPPKMPHLTEYEYMSLQATKALLPGDETAEALLTQLHLKGAPSRSVLAIKRFDRTPEGGKIHFEEFNQLLNKPNADRYNGSYDEIADFIREKMGQEGVKQFYARLMCQFLLGNTDSHLKNFALFHPDGKPYWSMTPNYDLAPTSNYSVGGKKQNAIALKVRPLLNPPSKVNGSAEPYGPHVKRLGAVDYEHSQLTPKILVTIGESFGLSAAEIGKTLHTLKERVQDAKASILADTSPELDQRSADGKKSLRLDFCEKLDTRERQLLGRLNEYLSSLAKKHASAPAAFAQRRSTGAGSALPPL